MDSPSQGVVDIIACLETNEKEPNVVRFGVKGVGTYDGVLSDTLDSLHGNWNQGNVQYPLQLRLTSKDAAVSDKPNRPQYPEDPLPYPVHEVTFKGDGDDISLSGSLSVPSGDHTATVILLAGSGPQTRDQHVAGHHTFRVLSDVLTKEGIAVLRYDKRGVGKSTGNYGDSTLLDFGRDASSAVDYLSSTSGKNLLTNEFAPLGIIGHSEGGLTAPIAFSMNKKKVNFLVLMGSMGMNGLELQKRQSEAVSKVSEVPEDFVTISRDFLCNPLFTTLASDATNDEKAQTMEQIINQFENEHLPKEFQHLFPGGAEFHDGMKEYLSPWFKHFFNYDPLVLLRDIASEHKHLPVLCLGGGKDVQVLPENLEIVSELFTSSGAVSYEAKQFDDCNHLFQRCKTGSPAEYNVIEETMNPLASKFLSDWIKKVSRELSSPNQ